MEKRLCVIGGSGFVGRAIVRRATRAGYRVTVACRHPEKARHLTVEGVRLVRADIASGKGLDAALRGADAVINLVGVLYEKGRFTFDAVHVHGTEHVLDACAQQGVPRYVHMSALGAGAVPESAYARSKSEAEARVRAANLAWTVFRPSVIYGEHDSFFNRFKAIGAWFPVMPVIAPEMRLQPVWVEDVARAFVRAIEDKRTFGQCFVLAGPKPYTMRALLELLHRELGRRRLLLPLPSLAARLLARLVQWLPVPPLTLDQLALLRHDNVASGEPFPALFGKPAPLEQVLPTYIHGSQREWIQRRLDAARRYYRKGGL
ncbi:MAG: complex I NDUFA9 subunit family protein [Zetaproteobacteria bacterium]|nr:MAG: complex I NDUFA9 subunit family protein [Zetaproteobacteria bacterium]